MKYKNYKCLLHTLTSIFLCVLSYLPSTKTPIRYGVGAPKNAIIEGGNAGISVCCHIIGNSKDSIASNKADKSLKKYV